MTTYIEIHALHSVPPSNLNRDDSGTPKTALYGGVTRHRVSSQSWKHAIRKDFNNELDPTEIGTRSRMLASTIEQLICERQPALADRALDLAADAMEAAGFKRPVAKKRGKSDVGTPESGYLVFLSQLQLQALADAAVEASVDADPKASMKAAKIKGLVDADNSIDIALFGRMVAESTDLNVDAACQVAHAISVHEATPEYDFFTAVDDAKSRSEDEEDSGAGMMGTVGFLSSTLYRYAALNVDMLHQNLGNDAAVRKAISVFMRSFFAAMPGGKQNTFAHGTRPAAVLVTIATGQPTSLVGAFESPIRASDGYVKPAVAALAKHAREVFETWRQPELVLVTGLPGDVGALSELGAVVPINELISTTLAASVRQA